jgi:hypothetical protein
MTGLTQGTGERQAAGMIARAVPLGLGIDDDDDLGAEFFSSVPSSFRMAEFKG